MWPGINKDLKAASGGKKNAFEPIIQLTQAASNRGKCWPWPELEVYPVVKELWQQQFTEQSSVSALTARECLADRVLPWCSLQWEGMERIGLLTATIRLFFFSCCVISLEMSIETTHCAALFLQNKTSQL